MLVKNSSLTLTMETMSSSELLSIIVVVLHKWPKRLRAATNEHLPEPLTNGGELDDQRESKAGPYGGLSVRRWEGMTSGGRGCRRRVEGQVQGARASGRTNWVWVEEFPLCASIDRTRTNRRDVRTVQNTVFLV
jgi:hypothetical protein